MKIPKDWLEHCEFVCDNDGGAAWLDARAKLVTASNASAILGRSRYQSPLGLWIERTGRKLPDPVTVQMLAGLHFEEANRTFLESLDPPDGPGWTSEPAQALLRSKKWPWLGATLDAYILPGWNGRPMGALELKNQSPWMLADWDDGPPDEKYIQVQVQMAVTGMQWAAIGVVFDSWRPGWHVIERDDALIEEIAKESFIWLTLVDSDDPPDPNWLDTHGLASLYPEEFTQSMELSWEARQAAERYVARREQLKELKKEQSHDQAIVAKDMTDFKEEKHFERASWPDGRVTWNTNTKGTRTMRITENK